MAATQTMEREVRADGADAVTAVVMVPTFRRPGMLAATLASLAAQIAPFAMRVVVIDNDAAGAQGLAVADRILAEGRLAGVAAVEPRQGNCHAINAALALAQRTWPDAPYLLMIDDDEMAAPDWLARMVEAAERSGADLVGGPVFPLFTPGTPAAMRGHAVFQPGYAASGPVRMIYGSGNFLVRRSALARLDDPTFDTRFNFLGGGDTDFFTRCRLAGLASVWAQEARVEESVPPSRTTTRWILKRGLRIGAVNYLIDRRHAGSALRIHAKNLALVPTSLWRGLRLLFATGSPLQASHPVMVALGRLLASLGVETAQYRAAPPATAPR